MSKIVTRFLVAATVTLALATGAMVAGNSTNEVGALLVYPIAVALPGQETLISITNTSPAPIIAHVAFIDGFPGTAGDPNPNYCAECDFNLPLTGNDTELLVLGATAGCGTGITIADGDLSMSCPQSLGMVVVTIQNAAGQTITDNVLIGSEVVVDYIGGSAFSLPAIAFQGGVGDSNNSFVFDDREYSKFPRAIGTDFIAPDPGNLGAVTAELALFTLGFDRQFPPLTDCSFTGFDAHENPFSGSFQFGCWSLMSLWEMSPEFAYPNLGLVAGQPNSHGWLTLDCRVDSDRDGSWDASGGVHGAMLQRRSLGALPRPPFGGLAGSGAAWSRALFQSVTTGDAVTLHLGPSSSPLE